MSSSTLWPIVLLLLVYQCTLCRKVSQEKSWNRREISHNSSFNHELINWAINRSKFHEQERQEQCKKYVKYLSTRQCPAHERVYMEMVNAYMECTQNIHIPYTMILEHAQKWLLVSFMPKLIISL